MTELITPPLLAYLEDKAIRQAVDEMVDVIEGKTTSAETWEDSRNYSQALLMAATVRAAYVEMLYELWERTWGAASAADLGDEYFDVLTVAEAWNDRKIYKVFYTESTADAGGASLSVSGSLDPHKGVSLSLYSWDADDEAQEPGDLADVPGWHRLGPDDYLGIETDVIPIKTLLSNPDAALGRLREAARELVEALRR